MKQTITLLRTILCTFICIVLIHNNTQAQDHYKWAVTKQKDYSKSYPVGNETLSLKNQFGKMESLYLQEINMLDFQIQLFIT